MKKIKYEEPICKMSEMVEAYRTKIKEALEERNIAVVWFGNAPATNPNDEYFECYELLKYEDGLMWLAQSNAEWNKNTDVSTVLTKEQVEAGAVNEYHFAETFNNAIWQMWEWVEEEGANSWDSLYYCLCEAINNCADED